MMHRLRTLAALLALLALSLYWVEGVWASMCPAEMEIPAAVDTDAEPHPEGCPMGGGERAPEPEDRSPRPPACPLVPAGATGCVGSAALLPASTPPEPEPAASDPSDPPLSHAWDLLPAAPPLRPPRA